MARNYWLVKQEPEDYSWENLVRDKSTAWTGVRNFQARNNLRQMQPGDLVFYYHTGEEKRVVGAAKVAKAAYPDPTAEEGDWSCVDLAPVKALAAPVDLAVIKSDASLKSMALVKQSRLSVLPVTQTEADRLLALSKTKL